MKFRNIKIVNIFLSFLTICISFLIIFKIHSIIFQSIVPFDTDEADHANRGYRLFYNFLNLSFIDFTKSIFEFSFYPPLNGFITAASYLITSPTLYSSRVPSLLLSFTAAIFFISSIFRHIQCNKEIKFLIIAVSFSLFYGNVVFIENSLLCMTEMLAVFLVTIILFLSTFKDNYFTVFITSIAGFLLFLTKYSFGICVLPGIIVYYFITRFTFGLASLILSTSLISTWIINCNLESFEYFLFGHPSYAPIISIENILFDLTGFIFEYNQNYISGIIILSLFLLGLFLINKFKSIKLSLLVFLSTGFILLLSTTNEYRHFIVAVPFIWFIALTFIVKTQKYYSIISSALIIILLSSQLYSNIFILNNLKTISKDAFEGSHNYGNAINFAVTNLDPSKQTLVAGTFDRLSTEAIRWSTAVHYKKNYSLIHIDNYPLLTDKAVNSKLRNRNADLWFINNLSGITYSDLDKYNLYEQIILFRPIGVRNNISNYIKEITSVIPTEKIRLRKSFGQIEVIIIEK
jgi:hypothetical protein